MSNLLIWSKRVLLIAVVCLFVVVLLARIGGNSMGGGKVQIRWWNMFAGPDGKHALGMVRAFNESHPEVHASMQRLEFNTFYSKVFVAGLGGRSPEVFIVHSDLLPRFVQAGLVRPLDDLIAESGISKQDFDPNIFEAVTFEDSVYAIPLDIHPMGMYYNATMFEKAGVVDENGTAKAPETGLEFLEAIKKITNIGGRAFVITWARINMYTIMQQFNGRMFNEDFSVCTLNSAENVRALKYIVDLIYEDELIPRPQNLDPYTGFRQGNVGIVFEGPWMMHDFMKSEDFEVKVASIPQFGERPATWANSHSLVISADIPDEKLDAAWSFIEYISDESLTWAKAGQVPARRSVRESEGFKSMIAQGEFARQIENVEYFPRVPYLFEFLGEFDLAIERALRGEMSPQEALDRATDRINDVIERNHDMKRNGAS
ncbi:putative arabinose-binding protein precursor [Poriferisphaera corsica]|uniref:Putative arabinose-binding protein n=1 Tax=Poriferisphaera corsica TaxID=2528020 RepID=A0A517YTA8_9BACT|nr:ABC transporter substrate-binding protein [Poriferisphaera corsica]QDU33441.1 putative arabinose-binding protein precursor [Poriferisphaera corsica]